MWEARAGSQLDKIGSAKPSKLCTLDEAVPQHVLIRLNAGNRQREKVDKDSREGSRSRIDLTI